ncbi:transposase [Xenorhabdus kozodoii]|uniref:Transposase n=1 Tax=Xenorhabdus kozodoii TaxID=351676 RepID=A0A2D0KYB2_9GAMM|nr:transposase [Xenorhabdus kozodoii]
MLPASLRSKLFLFMQQNGLVYNKKEHRLTFESILYRMRTGIPWRDLPETNLENGTPSFDVLMFGQKKAFLIYYSKCCLKTRIPNGYLLMAVLYGRINIVREPPQRKMKLLEKASGTLNYNLFSSRQLRLTCAF